MINKDFKSQHNEGFNWQGKVGLKIIFFTSFIALSLVFTQLVFANNLAIDGQKLSSFEDDIKKLEAENTTLKVEIAKESSLTNLFKLAATQGFTKPSKINTL